MPVLIVSSDPCFLPYYGLFFQIVSDFGELGEGGLKIFDDFGGDDVGVGKIGRFHDLTM